MARLGEQFFGLRRIVSRFLRLPIIFEDVGHERVAGQPRIAERQRLVDALAVDREAGGLAYPLVMPRRFRVPLLGESEPEGALDHRRLEAEPGSALQLLGQFAADRIDDIDLAAGQRGKPGRLVGNDLEHQPFDAWRLAPISLERLQHQLDAGVERDKFIGTGADRRLLEPVLADLLDIGLGHDPAGPGGAAVERQEIRPGFFELEADMPRIDRFYRGDPLLHHVVRGAAIALEGEFDVLGGDRLAVMEFGALSQRKVPGQAVFAGRPLFGEGRRQWLARHWLHQRVVDRVQDEERRDDPRRLGRVEPGRRQRDMDAPGQLALRRGGERHAGSTRGDAERGERQEIAARRAKRVAARRGRGVLPDRWFHGLLQRAYFSEALHRV